ncbi:hypothetical protein O9G_001150 [Rozella allomycis CSF55]|uniref:MORN repeat-containing protein 5 n=1 Tax=Rozella allomycis (strain CSF55) TaxID=988480 RepID=A0A075ASD0_ROZAC|nr:hypothetical protein O9G_001150 [Rozella allomycis CSF55]|eukprot:EPZ33181.1 hypothetical protein O9G_001150 [Rozella allomycis CSF55]
MSYPSSPFKFDNIPLNGRINGHGEYHFPTGNVYVGNFVDGQFHGHGTVHLANNGGKFVAEWDNGVIVKGTFIFPDGLIYSPDYEQENFEAIMLDSRKEGQDFTLPVNESWDYCTAKDRRFYSERISSINPAVVDKLPPKEIPSGLFDTGDGFYSPNENSVYDYQNEKVIRKVGLEEDMWIKEHCRKSADTLEI